MYSDLCFASKKKFHVTLHKVNKLTLEMLLIFDTLRFFLDQRVSDKIKRI